MELSKSIEKNYHHLFELATRDFAQLDVSEKTAAEDNNSKAYDDSKLNTPDTPILASTPRD